ncbi:AmmeMemoRadiSam system radical SAM enzyme, partial [Candidatus Parcubacteria bacterium]|nr:AmmeMemoRadiSam system radical SAM enzyme [Candidatus Parcubacteria bacterium]
NHHGQLFSLNYGRLIAAHVDPIEKKPLYHFLPGSNSFSIATAGCNFRCSFCQNWQISQFPKAQTRSEFPGRAWTPEEVVSAALENNCASIAYTYTEPTVFFEFAQDCAVLAKERGLKNVFVTNGFMSPEALKLAKDWLDAANIDLKSFSEKYYREVCGARLQPVLDNIKLMYQLGIWIEITTLVVPDQNDSPKELQQIAEFIASVSPNIPWHISRFHPDYQMVDGMQPTPLETLQCAAAIGKKAGLNFVYLGNVPAGFATAKRKE